MTTIKIGSKNYKLSDPPPTPKRSEMTRKEFKALKPRTAYITRKGKLAWKKTPKQIRRDIFEDVLGWIFFPFYWVWTKVKKFFDWLLWEHIRTGDNGIMGPGYHAYYTTRFAWGRLTFFVVIIFIIIFLLLGDKIFL
jgi:hypothetical protein